MRRALISGIGAGILILGACSSSRDGDSAGAVLAGTDTTSTTTTLAAPVVDEGVPQDGSELPAVEDYLADAALIDEAPDDRSLPPGELAAATGSYGYSRYVVNQVDGDIVPTLIEGPRGFQHRCQALEQQCSYLELAALAESDEPVPEYLGMEREELVELVAQLDAVRDAVEEHPTLEQACAAGFRIASSQNPNMGIHVMNPNGTSAEFDPGRPSMVLYAKEGGERLTRAEQGDCVDGTWNGEAGYESVGAVFTLAMSEEHPDAFAGPIDNWHIHLNTCGGSPTEGGTRSIEDIVADAENAQGGAFSRERCEEAGGFFSEVIPVWMMHAYVAPDHDAQGGVFAMFNPSIWPVVDDPDLLEDARQPFIDGAIAAPINNFDYGTIEAGVGESIVFSNSDSVPHTVIAGSASAPSGDFDSGVLGTGEAWEVSFDEPGSYELFCALHPAMSATVDVG